MISAGTRVVAFLAQNADVESVPYLIDEFTHVWETPFDVSLSVSSLHLLPLCCILLLDVGMRLLVIRS